jgi:hypothetical protein
VEVRFLPASKEISKGVLYLRPAFHRQLPTLPLLWTCKQDGTAPGGYQFAGKPGGEVMPGKYLPAACR